MGNYESEEKVINILLLLISFWLCLEIFSKTKKGSLRSKIWFLLSILIWLTLLTYNL